MDLQPPTIIFLSFYDEGRGAAAFVERLAALVGAEGELVLARDELGRHLGYDEGRGDRGVLDGAGLVAVHEEKARVILALVELEALAGDAQKVAGEGSHVGLAPYGDGPLDEGRAPIEARAALDPRHGQELGLDGAIGPEVEPECVLARAVLGREGLVCGVELARGAEVEGAQGELHVLAVGHELHHFLGQELEAARDIGLGQGCAARGHDIHQAVVLDGVGPGGVDEEGIGARRQMILLGNHY